MITSNPTHTLSVAIDVESLLKMVYAESAWRYFSQIAESQTSVLLDNDRRAIVIPWLHDAFASLCSALKAYITRHNLSSFDADGMLRIDIAHHKPLTSAGSESISTLISQILWLSILVKAYPAVSHYAQRLTHHRRSLFTILALDQQ